MALIRKALLFIVKGADMYCTQRFFFLSSGKEAISLVSKECDGAFPALAIADKKKKEKHVDIMMSHILCG